MGITLSEFLKMTPREFFIYLEAYRKNKEEDHKQKTTLAYANAMWTIQWLGKKKPQSLEKILNGNEPKKVMTDKEMLKQVKTLNALFGGEVN